MSFKNYFHSEFLEVIRDFTSFGNPFILFLISYLVLGPSKYLLLILIGLILIEIACNFIKLVYHKERPKKASHSNILEKINAGSFPSIHTARSSFVFLTLILLSNSFIQRLLFLILLIVVGVSRVFLRKHFKVDVIMGCFIGILAALLIILFGGLAWL